VPDFVYNIKILGTNSGIGYCYKLNCVGSQENCETKKLGLHYKIKYEEWCYIVVAPSLLGLKLRSTICWIQSRVSLNSQYQNFIIMS